MALSRHACAAWLHSVMCGGVCVLCRAWWGQKGAGQGAGWKHQEDTAKSSRTLWLTPGFAAFTSLLRFRAFSLVQIHYPSLGGSTQCGLSVPALVSCFHWMSVITPCPRAELDVDGEERLERVEGKDGGEARGERGQEVQKEAVSAWRGAATPLPHLDPPATPSAPVRQGSLLPLTPDGIRAHLKFVPALGTNSQETRLYLAQGIIS